MSEYDNLIMNTVKAQDSDFICQITQFYDTELDKGDCCVVISNTKGDIISAETIKDKEGICTARDAVDELMALLGCPTSGIEDRFLQGRLR